MDTIDFGGQTWPVKYGWNSLLLLEKELDHGLDKLFDEGKEIPVKDMILFIYVGLKEGARIAKKDFTKGVEDVVDMMDEEPEIHVKLTEFMEIFAKNMPQGGADTGKKK